MSDTPDDAEIERLYAQMRARQTAEAAATRAAELEPIRVLVETEAFAEVAARIVDLRNGLGINSPYLAHLTAAQVGMAGLKSAATLP